MKNLTAAFLCGAFLGCQTSSPAPTASSADRAPLRVSAASSLQRVIPDLLAAYFESSARRAEVAFASTGAIAQQVRAGAPIDLFLAADEQSIASLAASGDLLPDTQANFARGALVAVSCDPGRKALANLGAAADPEIHKIALANPKLAPYGKAAVEALQGAGLWSSLESRAVYGENVGQVFQYCETQNVDLAFVPLAAVQGGSLSYFRVPSGAHAPLTQALGVPRSCRDAEGARDLARFVLGERGRAILVRHGFFLP